MQYKNDQWMVEMMGNPPSDRLNPLFNNFALTARVFFTGAWCRDAVFDGEDSVGYLHLLRSGRISVKKRGAKSNYIDQPSALFYPRPCSHALIPEEGTEIDLVCTSLDFGDRMSSPLSLALPEMVILPLVSINTLSPLAGTAVFGSLCVKSVVRRLLTAWQVIGSTCC